MRHGIVILAAEKELKHHGEFRQAPLAVRQSRAAIPPVSTIFSIFSMGVRIVWLRELSDPIWYLSARSIELPTRATIFNEPRFKQRLLVGNSPALHGPTTLNTGSAEATMTQDASEGGD
jgi:hypothetical protein